MEKKTLNTLEYNKILKMISGYAVNETAKERILNFEPTNEYKKVVRWLNETDSAFVLLMKYSSPDISRIDDISVVLKRIQAGGALSMSELLNVARILKTSRSLKKYHEEKTDFLDSYFDDLFEHREIEELINNSIISEEEMADSASTELYSIRRKKRIAASKIKDTLSDMVRSTHYQKFLQDAIVTVRNNRYVVPVKAEFKGEIQGIVHDMSSSGGTLFIEPSGVVNANNELNELSIAEKAEIERILYEITGRVSEIADDIKENFENITELDFIFAKAKFAVQINAVTPRISKNCELNIVKGRHPLLNPKTVVPANISLGIDFDSLIVTGPNTGGKTVILKTIGLFALMTQSGFMIPASEGTVMPVYDDIFADIGDEQSIEQSLSTFSSHMKNIVRIVNRVTPNSLALFDELGAGTDPIEGAALATAVLENIRQMGAKIVATTHYSELKLYAISTDRVENASCEFDVETLSPTYRILVGIPGKSNAFAISEKLGLPKFIIDRAKAVLSEENIKFEDILSTIEKNRQTAERDREEQEALKAELEKLRAEVKAERDKIDAKKAKIMKRANEKAAEIIEKAKNETDEMLKEIKEAKKKKNDEELNRAMEEVKKSLNIKLKKSKKYANKTVSPHKSNANINTLKIGQSVLIIDLNDKGSVLSINKKDETALIQVGIMKITSKISNLVVLEDDNVKKEVMKFAPKRGTMEIKDVKTEIDLRGQDLETALYETERFMDKSVMSGLHTITVIHGKGSGILRKGIQNMLKKHPSVKSYRDGKYGEGENGVTVIELK